MSHKHQTWTDKVQKISKSTILHRVQTSKTNGSLQFFLMVSWCAMHSWINLMCAYYIRKRRDAEETTAEEIPTPVHYKIKCICPLNLSENCTKWDSWCKCSPWSTRKWAGSIPTCLTAQYMQAFFFERIDYLW